MCRRRDLCIRSEEGQAAVEFALVVPVLIVLLLGIVQAGIAFHDYLTVTDAARAGARTAIVARFTGATAADIQSSVQDSAGGLDASKLNVSVADATDPTLSTAGSTVSVTVTYPYSINLLGWVVASGNLTSTMSDRLE